MCVRRIGKADTFGKKGEWQTNDAFRKEAIKIAKECGFDEFLSEEQVDDMVMILHKMGHVILSV